MLTSDAERTVQARRVLASCAAVAIFDGFDVQAMAFVATRLSRQWSVPVSQFGLVFAAALFGLLLGSLLVAPLADQVGRKPLAVGAAVWVGLATLTTAFCTTIPQVTAARFATGIGLGTRHRAYRLDRRPGAGRSRHRAGMVQCADSLSSRTCIVMRRRRCVVAGRSAPRE